MPRAAAYNILEAAQDDIIEIPDGIKDPIKPYLNYIEQGISRERAGKRAHSAAWHLEFNRCKQAGLDPDFAKFKAGQYARAQVQRWRELVSH